MFRDATAQEIDKALQQAQHDFTFFSHLSLRKRAVFLRKIAEQLENCGDALIQTAHEETHLPEARLKGERARTIYQLESYASACEEGSWLEVRIDTANPDKTPPKPDIRKMMVPLGPVVVFGASNFPFAYSTAGGDTACALATGCPVVVKAHPAHPRTSQLVADAIHEAVV
ncbi:MAG: aldehyde dehydrogenase family protein, partial [Chitinophagaceae bacterium]